MHDSSKFQLFCFSRIFIKYHCLKFLPLSAIIIQIYNRITYHLYNLPVFLQQTASARILEASYGKKRKILHDVLLFVHYSILKFRETFVSKNISRNSINYVEFSKNVYKRWYSISIESHLTNACQQMSFATKVEFLENHMVRQKFLNSSELFPSICEHKTPK